MCTRRDFVSSLRRELKSALKKLQSSNIAPVDMAQAAIGPGIAVYSRYTKVLEASGEQMSVRAALQLINQELDFYFNAQDGELDADSRFCVDLYTQYAFNDIKYGDANVLANAKGTSVKMIESRGAIYAEKGLVHLLTREELSPHISGDNSMIWLLTQQLVYKMETGGIEACASIISSRVFGPNLENAKALAYRLYAIAERKNRAAEALAYNALILS